jgi:hypothetical protein
LCDPKPLLECAPFVVLLILCPPHFTLADSEVRLNFSQVHEDLAILKAILTAASGGQNRLSRSLSKGLVDRGRGHSRSQVSLVDRLRGSSDLGRSSNTRDPTLRSCQRGGFVQSPGPVPSPRAELSSHASRKSSSRAPIRFKGSTRARSAVRVPDLLLSTYLSKVNTLLARKRVISIRVGTEVPMVLL